MTQTVLAIIVAYLLGCFTTGYYLVRLSTGQDIRATASGNLGSRNVGRLLGTKGFILTFVGDAGKGVLAVWLARHLSPAPWLPCATLLAAVAGHIWPLQLGLRGGKGFATFAGGMILLKPLVLLAGLALCGVAYPFLRGTTKTGLVALACSPLFVVAGHLYSGTPPVSVETALYCLLVLVVLYAHRNNIRKEFFNRGIPRETS
ncbi:glycerol-3-phosphate acyltransferase [Geobacter sp. FeAm09]|uniref:glycerol-3-phosphate acyltransferase n=1 Tax=Geobacter sp. FeAm09 TaxID=2597769 RepID=UPI0011F0386C|nr:glycerol-3-phosphate acyltransferase [Geobacter sp. FeAm09]QEM68827.1 glycerol-3-phosphate acyltransferase [Geobacter sp. FeAm09]